MVKSGKGSPVAMLAQRASARRATKSTKQGIRETMLWDDKVLFWCVITSTVAVLVSLSTLLFDTPKEIAEKELRYLTDEYYITYLYPRLLGNYQPEEIMPEYSESGVATTYLRQMLLFNNGEHANSEAKFTDPSYSCDVNLTGVRYFPQAPYGPHDYEVSYIWHCKESE